MIIMHATPYLILLMRRQFTFVQAQKQAPGISVNKHLKKLWRSQTGTKAK